MRDASNWIQQETMQTNVEFFRTTEIFLADDLELQNGRKQKRNPTIRYAENYLPTPNWASRVRRL